MEVEWTNGLEVACCLLNVDNAEKEEVHAVHSGADVANIYMKPTPGGKSGNGIMLNDAFRK